MNDGHFWGGPPSRRAALDFLLMCVCCVRTPTARNERKCLERRALETVRVCECACDNDYRFPYLWPSPPSRLPICRRSGGRGGERGKREGGGGKKAIGRFRGERCSGPVSFYGPLKKKRENEHPSCLDWLLLLRFPGSFHKLLLSTLLSSYNGHSCIYPGSLSSGCRKPAKISTTNDLP